MPFSGHYRESFRPACTLFARSWRIDNQEIASSFLFRFLCVCECFQKNKLIGTLGESLSICFAAVAGLGLLHLFKLRSGKVSQYSRLLQQTKAAANQNFTAGDSLQYTHAHTHTHTHLHKHTYTSACNYRLNNIQRRCKLVEYLCSAHSVRLPTVGRQVRRGIDERQSERG